MIMENSAFAPVGISAKISGKPQTGSWILKFQKNNYVIPWGQYMGSMNKMSSSLISLFFSSAKGCFFVGIFNRSLCAHYQWLLRGEEDYRKGAGDFYFSFTLFVLLVFFATCKNYFYKLKKKLFSISKLPNIVVKEKTYFFQKKILYVWWHG